MTIVKGKGWKRRQIELTELGVLLAEGVVHGVHAGDLQGRSHCEGRQQSDRCLVHCRRCDRELVPNECPVNGFIPRGRHDNELINPVSVSPNFFCSLFLRVPMLIIRTLLIGDYRMPVSL